MEFATASSTTASAIAKADTAHLMSDPDDGRPIVKVDPLKVRPLDCRLVVRTVRGATKSDGGIIIPLGADKQRQLTMAEVIRVGDGRTTDHGVHIDIRVKPGDIVIIGKFAGSPIGQSEDYKIINEVEVLGIQEV